MVLLPAALEADQRLRVLLRASALRRRKPAAVVVVFPPLILPALVALVTLARFPET
jgi:hypothetical protein